MPRLLVLLALVCLNPAAAQDDALFTAPPIDRSGAPAPPAFVEGVAFEPVTKADLLVVVAHPDDESTFGGLLPHYAIARGKTVAFVCLTSGEWGNRLPHHDSPDDTPDYSYDDSEVTRHPGVPADALYPCYYRERELVAMLQTSGVPTQPRLLRHRDMNGFPDWGRPDNCFAFWGRELAAKAARGEPIDVQNPEHIARGRREVVGQIVGIIRELRPEVVVTMAYDGYNGNPQHLCASHGTIDAVEAAAAADEYPEAGQPHTVKKLYLAVSEGETYDTVHSHSWTTDCDGRPAYEIAADANALHASQDMPRECPMSSDFVLRLSTVGPDVVGKDDLFENVLDGAGADR